MQHKIDTRYIKVDSTEQIYKNINYINGTKNFINNSNENKIKNIGTYFNEVLNTTLQLKLLMENEQ